MCGKGVRKCVKSVGNVLKKYGKHGKSLKKMWEKCEENVGKVGGGREGGGN